MHMAATRLGCKKAIFEIGWAKSHFGCINRLRKDHSHLVGSTIMAGKAAWALSEHLPTKNAD